MKDLAINISKEIPSIVRAGCKFAASRLFGLAILDTIEKVSVNEHKRKKYLKYRAHQKTRRT